MTALGDDVTVPKILVLSDRTRVGKGLKLDQCEHMTHATRRV